MARPRGRTVKRSDVIEAGIHLLETRGPEAVTLSNVAARLGLRTPSLYNHVQGSQDLREGIIVEILDQVGDAVVNRISLELTTSDPETYVRSWATTWRAFAHNNANLVHYLMSSPLDWSEAPYSPTWALVMDRLHNAMVAMGHEGSMALHASRYCIATVQGFVRTELRGSPETELEADIGFAWLMDRMMSGLKISGSSEPSWSRRSSTPPRGEGSKPDGAEMSAG